MAANRAMWLWAGPSTSAEAVAAFARRRNLAEVFVSVPWDGPTATTRAIVTALRGDGVQVSALGGDTDWIDTGPAVQWARRAVAGGLFDRVHLDVEVWTRTDWPDSAASLLGALAQTITRVAAETRLPVDVDLPPWIAESHGDGFRRCVTAASSTTLLAFRDTAAGILSFSARARQLTSASGRPWRVGVETRDVPPPHTTFRQEGDRAMERALSAVGARLSGMAGFGGFAVHDFDGWRDLPA